MPPPLEEWNEAWQRTRNVVFLFESGVGFAFAATGIGAERPERWSITAWGLTTASQAMRESWEMRGERVRRPRDVGG